MNFGNIGGINSIMGNVNAGALNYSQGNPNKSTPTNFGGIGGVLGNSAIGGTSSSTNDTLAQLRAELARLQAQTAAAPKLASFDLLANYNKARAQATANVTPLYDQKLNIFLEGQGIKRTQKTNESNLAYENNTIDRDNMLADNATSRTRTGEDLASALQQIATNTGYFLDDDAQMFDAERRALLDETAAAGGTDTGLGQQAISQQLENRNTAADRQLTEFSNQEAAKNLLSTRTLADLSTSDTRSEQKKGQSDKAVKIDFDSYMEQLANDEANQRLLINLEKGRDIQQQSDSLSKQQIAQFINSLAGKGFSAQDIAYNQSIYMR